MTIESATDRVAELSDATFDAALQSALPVLVDFKWLRVGRPWPVGLLGALVIVLYGVIPTWQSDPHLGRVYAAYGASSSSSPCCGDGSPTASRPTAGTCSARSSASWAWA